MQRLEEGLLGNAMKRNLDFAICVRAVCAAAGIGWVGAVQAQAPAGSAKGGGDTKQMGAH